MTAAWRFPAAGAGAYRWVSDRALSKKPSLSPRNPSAKQETKSDIAMPLVAFHVKLRHHPPSPRRSGSRMRLGATTEVAHRGAVIVVFTAWTARSRSNEHVSSLTAVVPPPIGTRSEDGPLCIRRHGTFPTIRAGSARRRLEVLVGQFPTFKVIWMVILACACRFSHPVPLRRRRPSCPIFKDQGKPRSSFCDRSPQILANQAGWSLAGPAARSRATPMLDASVLSDQCAQYYCRSTTVREGAAEIAARREKC